MRVMFNLLRGPGGGIRGPRPFCGVKWGGDLGGGASWVGVGRGGPGHREGELLVNFGVDCGGFGEF